MDTPLFIVFVAGPDAKLPDGVGTPDGTLPLGAQMPLPIQSVNVYNIGLQPNDLVKTRKTDEDLAPELRDRSGRVTGVMTFVTVEFDDGTVETLNREQLKLRERDGWLLHQQYMPPKEKWQG